MSSLAFILVASVALGEPPPADRGDGVEAAPPAPQVRWHVTPEGLSAPSGIALTALPLPTLPEIALWVHSAEALQLNVQDERMRSVLDSACGDYTRRMIERNRQVFQPRYSELNAMVLADPASRATPEYHKARSELVAAAIKECRVAAPVHVSEWRRAVEAGAMASGQADRIDREALQVASARFHRELLVRRLLWGPVPIPKAFETDIEASLAAAKLDAATPVQQAAIEAYRRDATAGLSKCFEEFEDFYRVSARATPDRSSIERAMTRLLALRLATIDQLADAGDKAWRRWRFDELARIHPNGSELYELERNALDLLEQAPEIDAVQAALSSLARSSNAISVRATKHFSDFALVHWQNEGDRKPRSSRTYRDGMRACNADANAAIAQAIAALQAAQADAVRDRLIAESASLGALDASGTWVPVTMNKRWPGGLFLGSYVALKAPADQVSPEDPAKD